MRSVVRKSRFRALAVGMIGLSICWFQSAAQTFEKNLIPMIGDGQEEFGSSVSIDGEFAIVGAPLHDGRYVNSGAAYVFARTGGTWRRQWMLLPSDDAFDQQFGVSVAVDGRTAVIGAWRDVVDGIDSGAAYLFGVAGSDWLQLAKLRPSDGTSLDEFGRRVAIDVDTIAIAAAFDDHNGVDSGSVYIFVQRDGRWTQQAKLLPSDGQASDLFGTDIDIDGDMVIVGAALDDDQGNDAGSAYVFVRTGSTWSQQAKLLPDDGTEAARFGSSVSLDGETALIGAPDDDDQGIHSGSAYLFVRADGVWTRMAKLLPSGGGRGDQFGMSVDLSGPTAIVGAPHADDRNVSVGAAYLFVRDGDAWNEQAVLVAPDGGVADRFGAAIALDGGTVVGCSPANSQSGPNAGAAYLFRIGPRRCYGGCDAQARGNRDGESGG